MLAAPWKYAANNGCIEVLKVVCRPEFKQGGVGTLKAQFVARLLLAHAVCVAYVAVKCAKAEMAKEGERDSRERK